MSTPTATGQQESTEPIILFDGVCNLCAWSVQFIIKRDKAGIFRFTSLQSALGRELMVRHGLDPDALNSFVLVENDRAATESTAALHVARRLGWPLSWLAVFLAVPKVIRDAVYKFISRNRYRWFGKQDSCMMPTPQIRKRFLE